MKVLGMIIVLIGGGMISLWGVLMLVSDTLGGFLLGVLLLAVGLSCLYLAQRMSRAL